LFFGWEAVGLVSYLLIGFWYTRPTAIYANLKAFLVNRVGDFGFVLGIGLILSTFGTLDYAEVFAKLPAMASQTIELFNGSPWLLISVDLHLPVHRRPWASRRSSPCTSGCRIPWKARRPFRP